ncbi:restriction endonuclease subunit S [Maribellus sediminis]|uniref:restriction endonuclease subunit S n=1 Tax=Maribellus sediminis TaxID=2696285 RepID=UPI0014302C42|nr:restriction endonuclease subunit S [Maribellus sediminis]
MSSEWKIFKLSEICTKIGSGATPTGGKSSYSEEGEFALIRSQNVLDFVFSFDGLAYINNSQAQKLSNVEIQKEDVLINITGDSVARVCMVPNEVLPARVNQHVSILRADTSLFSPRLLKYLLLTGENKAKLLTLASSGATRNALTKSMLENFEVFAPEDVDEQEKLANVFQSLDDKIAYNNRINQTLEDIAQALFKSWFVDFEPVKAKIQALEKGTDPQLAAMCAISGKTEEVLQQLPKEKYDELAATANLFPDELVESELGMIPNGWKVSKLANVTNFLTRGLTPKYADDGVAVINQRCIRNQTIDFSNVRYHDEEQRAINTKQVLERDILINSTGVGTLGRVAIVKRLEQKSTVDTHITIVRADSNVIDPEYLGYFLLNKESIIEEMGEGSTGQTELKRVVLLDMGICVPERNVQNRFSEIVKRVISNVSNNEIENQKLISIRDLLIPKLLSGYFEFE